MNLKYLFAECWADSMSSYTQVVSSIDEFFKWSSLDGNNSAVVRCFMAARSLRPLRVLTRFKRLKFVGATTAGAMGMILRAAFCSLAVIFAFGENNIENYRNEQTKLIFPYKFRFPGILGQQLFMAKLGYCNDSLVFQRDKCVGEISDTGSPRTWVNPENNFGICFLITFALVTPSVPFLGF
jgi:hypothetical protein